VRILFVDDDPENVELTARTLHEALGADVVVVSTVEAAVAALHHAPVDIVVTDLFIPLGDASSRGALGPRARRYAEQVSHLGGLVLLDELDRVDPPPILLAHTACTDPILIELLGQRVTARVRKPAPAEVLLHAVLEAIRERGQGPG
jgi:CheY-like chemotaxis protein